MSDKLKYIDPKDIWWDHRYREDLGNIDELAESISAHGVLQPITVANEQGPNGQGFKLLAGERRTTAARKLDLPKIPALVKDLKEDDQVSPLEIELVENVFRKDMSWDERCKLIARLQQVCQDEGKDWSTRKIGALLNKSKSSVAYDLQMAEALEAIPELAECKTQDDARKLLEKMKEKVVVEELRKRQNTALAKGLNAMLKVADANYHAGEDAFVEMAALRSNGLVDLIECDPPYGIDLVQQKAGKDSVTSTVKGYNEVPENKYKEFLDKLAKETFRVAGNHSWMVFWYGPTWHTEVKEALKGAGWHVDDIPAIWVKGGGQTLQPEIYLARGYEPFFVCRKGQPILNKRGRSNVFQFSPAQDKYHPTQRPLDMMCHILDVFAVPGATVLVPFLGSGTTLRAAYKCGMKAWGYDLSTEYKDKFMLAVEQDSKEISEE